MHEFARVSRNRRGKAGWEVGREGQTFLLKDSHIDTSYRMCCSIFSTPEEPHRGATPGGHLSQVTQHNVPAMSHRPQRPLYDVTEGNLNSSLFFPKPTARI